MTYETLTPTGGVVHAVDAATVLVVGGLSGRVELLQERVRADGNIPLAVVTARQAAEHLGNPDVGVGIAVIDLTLADGSGLDLIPIADLGRIPTIIATANQSRDVVSRCFRAGADDVIGQPIDLELLSLRIAAILRRTGRMLPRHISHRNIDIDLEAREVRRDDGLVELTTKEFDLLVFLAGHPGRVYTREQLLASVWHSSAAWQQPGTVTEHIRRLRSKLEADPANPTIITTARGVGYRFERRSACRPHQPSAPSRAYLATPP